MEMKDFGKKLIEVRKSLGLTQEEIAEKCNITVRTIQRLESGQVKPRAYTVKILSEFLEFDFLSFLRPAPDSLKNSIEKRSIFWHMIDLFNLKTHTMKKLSILTSTVTITVFALFFLIPNARPQGENKQENKSKLPIQSAIRSTENRLEVVFSNSLTLDSLITIKNKLKNKGILLKYKKLEFDNTDHLSGISGEVIFYKDGNRGNFAMYMLDSANKDKNIGFYIDYSKNAKIPFGIGTIK